MHRSIAALALLAALAAPAPANAARGYGHPSSSPVPSASPRPTPTAMPEPVRPSPALSAAPTAPSPASPSQPATLPVTGTGQTWLTVFLGCMLVLCGVIIIVLINLVAPTTKLRTKKRYTSRHAGAKK